MRVISCAASVPLLVWICCGVTVSNAQVPDPVPATAAKKDVAVAFKAVDTQERPVAGATFTINGRTMGVSDADGRYQGRYGVQEGAVIRFGVTPPAGYRIPPKVDQNRWTLTVNHPPGQPLETTFSVELDVLGDLSKWTTAEKEDGFAVTLLEGALVDVPGETGESVLRLTLALRNATARRRPVKPMPIIVWGADGKRLPNVEPHFRSMTVAESNGRRVKGDPYRGRLAEREVLHMTLTSHPMKRPKSAKLRIKMEWKSPGQNTFVEGKITSP